MAAMSPTYHRPRAFRGPGAVTGLLTLWASLLGVLFGIVVALSQTVPELISSPASAGGTGSVGLVIVSGIVGAAVGLLFGLLIAVGGLAAGLVQYSSAKRLGWWTVVAESVGVGVVATILWFLVSLGGQPLQMAGIFTSPPILGLASAAVAFGLGTATVHPRARARAISGAGGGGSAFRPWR
jgi:hypothetical protein